MAIQKIKEGNSFNSYTQIFQIDSTNDLVTLEADYNPHFGDKAELPNGTVYIRHSDGYSGDLWEIAQSSGGGGGGGGGSSDLPTVTSADNGDLLGVVNGEWGKTEPPYTVEESLITMVAQQIVTTEDVGGYNMAELQQGISSAEEGELFAVTFDGTRYDVNAITYEQGDDVVCLLGEIDFDAGIVSFDNYPFFINGIIGDLSCNIFTESAGTHAVKIDSVGKTMTVSNGFVDAVNSVKNKIVTCDNATVHVDGIEEYGIVPTSVDMDDYQGSETTVTVNGILLPWDDVRQEWIAEDVGGLTYEAVYSGDLYLYVYDSDAAIEGDYQVNIVVTNNGNGGGPLFVVYTDDGGDYSCDTTLATIGAALVNGTPIIVTLKGSGYQMMADTLTVMGGSSFVSEFHSFDAKQNYFEVKILSLTHAVGDSVTGSLTTKTLQYYQGFN